MIIGVGFVLRVAEEARAGEEAANSGDDQAEEEELTAPEAEVIVLGHTHRVVSSRPPILGPQPLYQMAHCGRIQRRRRRSRPPQNPTRGRPARAVLAKSGQRRRKKS